MDNTGQLLAQGLAVDDRREAEAAWVLDEAVWTAEGGWAPVDDGWTADDGWAVDGLWAIQTAWATDDAAPTNPWLPARATSCPLRAGRRDVRHRCTATSSRRRCASLLRRDPRRP